MDIELIMILITIRNYYKFTVDYCESVNLIGYITVFLSTDRKQLRISAHRT